MVRRDECGGQHGKRKPRQRLTLIDWLPFLRIIIEWLLLR